MKSFNYSAEASRTTTGQQSSWFEQQVLKSLKQRLMSCHGDLHLTMPSGFSCHLGSGNGISATVKINSFYCLLRLFTGGINGWSEGYIAGEWDSPDLTSLVRWALTNEQRLEGMAKAGFITRSMHNLFHRRHNNSRKGSRKNIAAHYDLGNDFYQLWLDPGMTYSSALYKEGQDDLEQAQRDKYSRILELLNPSDGDHIVEIGCGWGGLAQQALETYNVRLHGITLSEEQLKWSRQRLEAAGLDDRSHMSLTDYRDLIEQYDGVVSIEMFEAVGEEYWDTYFTTLKRCLKTGGTAVLQVISIEDERFESYRNQADFIQRYIFPGGMLPSVEIFEKKCREHGFRVNHKQLFGKDYARTLREWSVAFNNKSEELKDLGYDDRFQRLWNYYLSYCEGGFEEGSIDVGFYQLVNEN